MRTHTHMIMFMIIYRYTDMLKEGAARYVDG